LKQIFPITQVNQSFVIASYPSFQDSRELFIF